MSDEPERLDLAPETVTVALGALNAAIRAQRERIDQLRAERGRTSPQARKAVARLDELREAHRDLERVSGTIRRERHALRWLVDALERGDGHDFELRHAREVLDP